MNLRKFLTKSLIWKPKTLKDGWEHKNGFFVSIDAKTALNMIDNAKKSRMQSKIRVRNLHHSTDHNILRKQAESLLYDIESSQNNYIEAIIIFGGFYLIANIAYAIPVVWNGEHKDVAQYFLICLGFLIPLIFIFFMKRKIDKANMNNFLEIEDALYQYEYGASQYKD